MPSPGRALPSLKSNSELVSHVHKTPTTSRHTLDEHQQLVHDGLGKCLTIERVEQRVDTPLKLVDHTFLLGLRASCHSPLQNMTEKGKHIRAPFASNALTVPSARYKSASPTREYGCDRRALCKRKKSVLSHDTRSKGCHSHLRYFGGGGPLGGAGARAGAGAALGPLGGGPCC